MAPRKTSTKDKQDETQQAEARLQGIAAELYDKTLSELTEDEANHVLTVAEAEANAGGPADPTPPGAEGESGAGTTPSAIADGPHPGSGNGDGGPRKVTTTEVREWLKAEGISDKTHGRIEQELKDKFLAAHPNTEIVAAPGKKAKSPVMVEVPVDAVTVESVPEEEWEVHPLTDGPVRSATQLLLDEKVEAVHKKWAEAGKPEVRKAPRDRIAIDPKYAPAIRWMLGQSGKLLKVQVKLQPALHAPDGREVIVFTAIDIPPKDEPKAEEKASAKG